MTCCNQSLLASIVRLPFILCVVVLAVAALGQGALRRWAKVVTRKDPIPLRKPLSLMNKDRLGDYRFSTASKMTAAVEDSLGTDAYLDWKLIDTSVPDRRDPRRHVRLFVTYYTGGPNLTPHTPDVCYVGGGYQPKQLHETRVIDVAAMGRSHSRLPVRVCTFTKTAIFNRDEPTVVYTFHANGEFTASRTGVRNLARTLTDKHAYFSKVEVSFGSKQCRPRNLGREESVEAAAKLFDTVLPLLITEHWPMWDTEEGSNSDERG